MKGIPTSGLSSFFWPQNIRPSSRRNTGSDTLLSIRVTLSETLSCHCVTPLWHSHPDASSNWLCVSLHGCLSCGGREVTQAGTRVALSVLDHLRQMGIQGPLTRSLCFSDVIFVLLSTKTTSYLLSTSLCPQKKTTAVHVSCCRKNATNWVT